jgi:high-affinity iron transporter
MKFFALIFLVFFISLSANGAQNSPRFLVHLLDYIAADYPGAVDKGKVISESEYAEQIEFAKSAVECAGSVESLKADPEISNHAKDLYQLVLQKAPGEKVSEVAREAQARVLKLGVMEVAPSKWPDRHHGKLLYEQNCTSCHGVTGHGDGPSGGSLDPKPSNFHDTKMDGLSPFQLFNTIRLGVPGTGMASFSDLSDSEVWDLAFYLVSLRHEGSHAQVSLSVPLSEAATSSDAVLREKYGLSQAAIGSLRINGSGLREDQTLLLFAREKLDESLRQFEAGYFDAAKTSAITAYLEGVEPVEPTLRNRRTELLNDIERKMAEVRARIDRRVPVSELATSIGEAKALLQKAEELLQEKEGSAFLAFTVASGIVLREAFEATLLLITLLGVIRSLGMPRAARYVHAGWIAAVVVGLITWFFSGWLMKMSGAQRETLEGAISGFAVVILLYFGFWLHRHTEIGKWHAFINDLVKAAVDKKSLFILGTVAFMGVFREAFETVLFLRALLLETGPENEWALGSGVVISFLTVLILSAMAIRTSARIPVRKLFLFSSVIMVVLAIILMGKTVHAFQETGAISITYLTLPFSSEILGLYPTLETLVAQISVFLLIVCFLILGRKPETTAPMRSSPVDSVA